MSLYWHWKPHLTYDMLCWDRKTGIVCVNMMASVPQLGRQKAFFFLSCSKHSETEQAEWTCHKDQMPLDWQQNFPQTWAHFAQHIADSITPVSLETSSLICSITKIQWAHAGNATVVVFPCAMLRPSSSVQTEEGSGALKAFNILVFSVIKQYERKIWAFMTNTWLLLPEHH